MKTDMLDWNWFFAAFAQCGAALIGIIAAFIISKLLAEDNKYDSIEIKLENLKIARNILIIKISDFPFNIHNRIVIENGYSIEKAISNDEFANKTDDEILQTLRNVDPSLFFEAGECLQYLKNRIDEINLQKGFPQFEGNTKKGKLLPDPERMNKLSETSLIKDNLMKLRIESEELINKFKSISNVDTINLKLNSIRFSIIALSIGFVATVIYPLHFMPLKDLGIGHPPSIGFSLELIYLHLFSLKGALLIIFTLIIGSIFGNFYWMAKKIEKKYADLSNLMEDSWLDVEEYCNEFQTLNN